MIDKERTVQALARHCAGLILIAMAERKVEFSTLDIRLDLASGHTRSLVDSLTDGNAEEPSLAGLSFIMSALDMELNVHLRPIAVPEETSAKESGDRTE
jgi:hypothetical protein